MTSINDLREFVGQLDLELQRQTAYYGERWRTRPVEELEAGLEESFVAYQRNRELTELVDVAAWAGMIWTRRLEARREAGT